MGLRKLIDRIAAIRLIRFADPAPAALLIVVTLVNSLVPAALALAIGGLVAEAQRTSRASPHARHTTQLVVLVLVVAGLVVAERVLPSAIEWIRFRVIRRIDVRLRAHVLGMLHAGDAAYRFDDPALQNQLGLIRGGLFGTPGAACAASIGVAGRYLQTIAALAIVSWFSPLLAAATFAVIVTIRVRWHKAFGELANSLIDGAEKSRLANYFADLLLTPAAAKEVRIYGLASWISRRQRAFWDKSVAGGFEIRSRLRRSARVELAALAMIYLATFTLAASAASSHHLSLAMFAALLQAEFAAAQLVAPGGDDYALASGLAALQAVSAMSVNPGAHPEHRTVSAAGMPRVEICFDDVAFTYPGSQTPALDGFSLTIKAGQSVAIVGANGAGKTTVVKLLCGMYRPDRGRILVDGRRLDELDLVSWRSRMAAIFQDFVHYEASARDNVVFGAIDHCDEEAALLRAMERSGALDVLGALPDGLDTVLCAQYDRGVDLSGGQWQRVALARALFAVETGAGVLVLDEPTANLDVRAEAEIYDRFLELTAGVTSVVISHRFSTVRRAQHIVVIDRRKVSEEGDHDELMRAQGRYAAMFNLQAQRFADTQSGREGGGTDA